MFPALVKGSYHFCLQMRIVYAKLCIYRPKRQLDDRRLGFFKGELDGVSDTCKNPKFSLRFSAHRSSPSDSVLLNNGFLAVA